jgi:biopolymer transport protein ExbD
VKRLVPRARPLLEGLGIAAVDTVMNLFIFFFVAFSLLASFQKTKEAEKQRAHELQLPPSGREAPLVDPDLVVVDLSEDGRIALDGKAVEREQLTAALKRRLAEGRRGVVVRADRRQALGTAVTVLDLVWSADPPAVSIATVDSSNGGQAHRP